MSWNGKTKQWYNTCVGEKGHFYHQTIVIPGILRLLNLQKGEKLLDIGCGQGVLLRHLPPNVEYTGIDNSKDLLQSAKKHSPQGKFHLLDATKPWPQNLGTFDATCFLLSLQNMPQGDLAIQNGASHLQPGGRMVLVLNHPCFRIPRQSHWGVDPSTKVQFRRLDRYGSPLEIPIQTRPSEQELSTTTFSYHTPLSTLFSWLFAASLVVEGLEEWYSPKESTGKHRKREDRSREEFPLFLALALRKTS